MLVLFKKILKKLMGRTTITGEGFSQSGEDAILKTFFYDKLVGKVKGLYVDVGAFHPYNGSNTYYYYLRGWSGINIDAAPGSMKAFNKLRPRDINIEIGVGLKDEVLTFNYLGQSSSMNSFSEAFLKSRNSRDIVKSAIQIQVKPLSAILDQYLTPNQVIDFLSVDVEGLDLEVLKSNNWSKYRPRVVLVEMEAQQLVEVSTNEITKFLEELGYVPFAKTLLSDNLASVVFAEPDFFGKKLGAP